MNDLEILKRIHEELHRHKRFSQNMIDFYGHLVSRVPEDGFEQILDDDQISLEQETAILQLQKYDYLDRTMRGIGHGRIEHYIDLRGKRFFELAKEQSAPANELETPETDWRRMSRDAMHDSGNRETFSTGAVRDSAEGKPRPELISPFAMERLAEWLRKGAEKYAPRNWEAGIPLSRCTASLCRHLLKFQQGATDEDHVAAILCNAMFIAHIQEMCKRGVLPKSLLDMPDYRPPNVHSNGDEVLDYEPDEEFRWKKIHEQATR